MINALIFVAAVSSVIQATEIQEIPDGWKVVDRPGNGNEWQCLTTFNPVAISIDAQQNIHLRSERPRLATYYLPPDKFSTDGYDEVEVSDKTRQLMSLLTSSGYEAVWADYEKNELPEGTFYSANHGEFGGWIAWEGPSGVPEILMTGVNPVAFKTRDETVVVAEGLNSGRILSLSRQDDIWSISVLFELNAVPVAAYGADGDAWIFLNNDAIVRVDLTTGHQETIYRDEGWIGIYKTSVLPVGDSWLIGTDGAIMRLKHDDHGYREEWLIPADCEQYPAALPQLESD